MQIGGILLLWHMYFRPEIHGEGNLKKKIN